MNPFIAIAAAVQTATPSVTPEPLWLAAGGLFGAFVRAFFVKHQSTWSRETGFDCIVGCLFGLLWNVPLALDLGTVKVGWPPFDFAPSASYVQRGAIVAVVSLIAVEILKRILIKTAPEFLEHRLKAVLPPRGNGNGEPKDPAPKP